MAKSSKRRSSEKLRALMRTQAINELLSKSITESEALQNSGDDRPVYESHVTDLLESKPSRSGKAQATRPSRARMRRKAARARKQKRRR